MNKFSKIHILGSTATVLLILTLTLIAFAAPALKASAVCESGSKNCTDFTVSANEMLEVEVIKPSSWATSAGKEVKDFEGGLLLTNKIGLSVTTNNTTGFVASMTTATPTTALQNEVNSTVIDTIPVLSSSTYPSGVAKASFPANFWGYSKNDATYYTIPDSNSTPVVVASNTASTTTTTQDLYFSSKADLTKASGAYKNTVVISVVTGTINTDDPKTPGKPSTPGQDPIPNDNTAVYNTTTNQTVVRNTGTTSINNVTYNTTATTVTPGNTVNSTYASPQGVSTTAAINEGTPLATGLAVTAGVAATAGVIFFIIAKRRRDDEEEEEYQ